MVKKVRRNSHCTCPRAKLRENWECMAVESASLNKRKKARDDIPESAFRSSQPLLFPLLSFSGRKISVHMRLILVASESRSLLIADRVGNQRNIRTELFQLIRTIPSCLHSSLQLGQFLFLVGRRPCSGCSGRTSRRRRRSCSRRRWRRRRRRDVFRSRWWRRRWRLMVLRKSRISFEDVAQSLSLIQVFLVVGGNYRAQQTTCVVL